jgi:hypothetical protein
MGLFWKQIHETWHITQSEEKLPGHKSGANPDPDVRSSRKVQNSALYHSAISDPWVKICTATNASGSYKIKPLVVYHAQNPVA